MPAASARRARSFVFAGPTLHRALAAGLSVDLGDFVVLPPVRRGDVQRLVATSAPSLLVVVDGTFHLDNLAVGHAELRLALEAGWEVWGISSMGAIRAAELGALGMRGFGRVHERYATDPRFRDDEVALLHEPGPPYRAFSEPLIHMRVALAALVDEGALAAAARDEIVAALMAMWFGDRTLDVLRALVAPHVAPDVVARWLVRFDAFQWKSIDLVELFATRPFHGR